MSASKPILGTSSSLDWRECSDDRENAIEHNVHLAAMRINMEPGNSSSLSMTNVSQRSPATPEKAPEIFKKATTEPKMEMRRQTPLHTYISRAVSMARTISNNPNAWTWQIEYLTFSDIKEYVLKNPDTVNVPDQKGNTALHLLAAAWPWAELHDKIFCFFLSNGADVNLKNDLGRSVLHTFISPRIYSKQIESLIKAGADVHAVDNEGKTPLHLVLECHGIKYFSYDGMYLLRTLLHYGAKTTIADSLGDTPLHKTIDLELNEYNFAALSLLLKNGAKVNARNNKGRTAFHDLVALNADDKNEHREAVKLFLEHGADLNLKDRTGNSPLHMVHRESEILDLLMPG